MVSVDQLLALLERRAPRPLTIAEMARQLEMDRYDPKALRATLEAEVARGRLRRIGKTRYQWLREADLRPPAGRRAAAPPPGKARRSGGRAAQAKTVEGRYVRVRRGHGFVEVSAPGFARDILIPETMEGAALHGDEVAVRIEGRRGARLVGRVIAVTRAANSLVLGTLEQERGRWHLVPDDDRLPVVDITGGVPLQPSDADQIALVRLTGGAGTRGRVAGVVDRVLGDPTNPEVQILAVALEYSLRLEFGPEAIAEAEHLPPDPDPADFAGREDLRDLPFVTIDGETARDFDDAVHLEPRRGGGLRLWVAIADVAHYVGPGSALDAEAAARGNSVYFPDRALPMLPPRLSSELCSLNPGRDRLVLAVEMTYDAEGHRRGARLLRAVIRSAARLTYTRVAAVLSTADSPEIRASRDELHDLLPQLRRMHGFMRLLYQHRLAAGSLDLDLPESLVDLSEEGRSVGVRLFQRNDAHRMIEEFMLEANCAVAEHLRGRDVPFPYRVHEPPDPEKIEELNQLLAVFGFSVHVRGTVKPAQLQRVLDKIASHRLARVLTRMVLRSLTQARYTIENAGHFGLAFPVYCHFTSPIRRYPDLLVHRQLRRVLDGDLDGARDPREAERLERASLRSSKCERNAMEAERAMLDLKKAEFMLEHLLEPQMGTVVSVTKFGLFVELDAYPIEGLVRIDDLPDDRYRYRSDDQSLVGLRSRRRFRLGDRLNVEATNVSLRERRIDFAVV